MRQFNEIWQASIWVANLLCSLQNCADPDNNVDLSLEIGKFANEAATFNWEFLCAEKLVYINKIYKVCTREISISEAISYFTSVKRDLTEVLKKFLFYNLM